MNEKEVVRLLKEKQGDRTQTQLAKDLKVTPAFINDVLNGRRRPSDLILKYLGLEKTIVRVR